MSKPTDDQYQLYEKARKRTKQKKGLLSHFIFFLIGAIFLVILNKVIKFHPELDWFVWAIFIWLFFLLVHTANVFILKPFFGKEWERVQTEKLMEKHGKKLDQLEKKLEKKGSFTSDNSSAEVS